MVILSLVALPLSAQQPTLTAEQIKTIAAQLELKPGSRQFRRLMSGTPADLEGKGQVIKHVRGSAGLPFPTRDELEKGSLVPAELLGFEGGEVEAAEESGEFESSEGSAEELVSAGRIPSCDESVDYHEATETGKAEEGKVIFDMLFAAPDQVPDDPAAAFGELTSVRIVDDEKSPGIRDAALSMGVRCLPTRIRVTSKFRFWEEGINALRNYESDPNGQGMLHVSVADRVKGWK